MSLNETFKGGFLYWILAAFCGGVVIGACAYGYPMVAGSEDATGFARSIVMSVGRQTLGNLCLMGGLLFANLILPKDYLERISDSPGACAAVLAAVLFGLAWINGT